MGVTLSKGFEARKGYRNRNEPIWIEEFPYLAACNQIGFLADEVERVIPDIMSTDEQGYKAIVYSRIVAMNTGAIQALHDKINE